MADTMKLCAQLIMEDQYTLDHPLIAQVYLDETLNFEINIADSTWKVYYYAENGFIHMYAPLLRKEESIDSQLTQELLRKNITRTVARFAFDGDYLCLRSDYPEEGFQEEEFKLLHRDFVSAYKKAVRDLALSSMPEGDW